MIICMIVSHGCERRLPTVLQASLSSYVVSRLLYHCSLSSPDLLLQVKVETAIRNKAGVLCSSLFSKED